MVVIVLILELAWQVFKIKKIQKHQEAPQDSIKSFANMKRRAPI